MLNATWDVVLIAVSWLVAILASFVALDTAGKVAVSDKRAALIWNVVGGTAMGIGIWSMHFIGMLAMNMPMPMRYDLTYTALSLIVAVVTSIVSLRIAVTGNELNGLRLFISTVILAGGIVSMHYTGMAAVMIADGIIWNGWLVALSLLIAVVASGAALWLAFHLRQGAKGLLLMRLIASLVMGAAIAAMHYTGMAAATFYPSPHMHMGGGLNQQGLSVWVAVVTLVILGSMLVLSMLDAQVRAYRLAESLQHANNQLERIALYDHLTELANRTQFYRVLEQRISQGSGEFVVMYMDLDGFKLVNDAWGHHVGDRLLKSVATRMQALLSEEMTLARLGGDEFVLLAPQTNINQTTQLADKLVNSIDTPFQQESQILRVSLSIGIATYPLHGTTAYTLMLNADAAMYSMKKNGRNGWAFYNPNSLPMNQQQPALLQELIQALGRRQFKLYYQPRVSAISGKILGFEALLRWQNPNRGMLMPEDFLPMAEKTGLIVEIGEWVIDEACRQLQLWRERGHHAITMSINISTVQFEQQGLLGIVTDALARHQIPPGLITLEITETVALRNLDKTAQILNQFDKLGIKVSIDDFGTGYSNLIYLRQLPARELKIDRLFVKELQGNEKNTRVVSAIIEVARSMNLEVVAEGIETPEQQALLTALGCTSLQGFLLGSPTPAEKMDEIFNDKSRMTSAIASSS